MTSQESPGGPHRPLADLADVEGDGSSPRSTGVTVTRATPPSHAAAHHPFDRPLLRDLFWFLVLPHRLQQWVQTSRAVPAGRRSCEPAHPET